MPRVGPGTTRTSKVHLSGTHKSGETLWADAHETKGRLLFGKHRKRNIGTPFTHDNKTVDESFKTL
jgi:hypothetical protein